MADATKAAFSEEEMLADLAAADAAGDSATAQHIAGLIKQRRANAAQNSARARAESVVNGMGPVEGAVTAFGEAARHKFRQAANLLPLGIGPSDADVKEASEINAPLFKKHPWAAFLGGASLEVPTAVLAGTAAAPVVGSGLLANALASGAISAAQGGTFSDPGSRGTNAIVGGTVGTVLPFAISGGKNALKYGGEKAGFIGVKPTPEAQALMKEGVPLTRGQMNPDSAIGQIEEVGAGSGIFGPSITGMRDRAVNAWRGAVLKRATAPGQVPPQSDDVQGALAQMRTGFNADYAPLKNEVIPFQEAQRLGRALPKSLIPNPKGVAGAGVEDSSVSPAARAVRDAISSLPEGALQSPGMAWNHLGDEAASTLPPWLKTGDLQKLREVIRDQIRTARQAGDWEQLRLLQRASDEVTDSMGRALSPQQAAQLKAIDQRYRNFMTVENAAGRGGPNSEFTPRQLHAAVNSNAGTTATVEGNAGELQDLAQIGDAVFGQRSPYNGSRLLSAIPVVGKFLNGPVALGMNLPAARKAALTPVDYSVNALTPGKMTMNELIAEMLRKKESR